MIAVTSLRPPDSCPPEIQRNQERALRSWEEHFERTICIENEGEDAPRIKTLCETCAEHPGWSAIVNADILVAGNFEGVCRGLIRSKVECAISKRYQFDGDRLDLAVVDDEGLDFFAARQDIWRRAAEEIPEVFRLGRIVWDTWMLGFFMHVSQDNCADITPAQVIFHPRHGDRHDQHIEVPQLRYPARWPGFRIGVGWPRQIQKRVQKMVGGGGGGLRI